MPNMTLSDLKKIMERMKAELNSKDYWKDFEPLLAKKDFEHLLAKMKKY